jgi:hypothetical protein
MKSSLHFTKRAFEFDRSRTLTNARAGLANQDGHDGFVRFISFLRASLIYRKSISAISFYFWQ